MRAVVTGRMRRHGDIISIQADLIDLQNVAQLWGQHYDHKLSDALLVQDDISRDIFENLRLKLNVEEKKQLEAYGLYLKGRNAWNKRTGDALLQAIDFFNQAIAIDPDNSAAYAGIAEDHGTRNPSTTRRSVEEIAVLIDNRDVCLSLIHI